MHIIQIKDEIGNNLLVENSVVLNMDVIILMVDPDCLNYCLKV